MALLPILKFPDPRLHTVAKPVQEVDDRIRKLVKDMAETMYDAPGVGLAATQVDVHERVVVIDVSESGNELLVLINPEITWKSEELKVYEEGCLSVPDTYDKVERAANIRFKARMKKASGTRKKPMACWPCVFSMNWTTWMARCLWSTCPCSSVSVSAAVCASSSVKH